MWQYIAIALFSFLGVSALIVQNARRIAHGKVDELHPMSVRDLIRPLVATMQEAGRTALVSTWAKILEISHRASLFVGKKFLELAWSAKGRHAETETPDEGAIAKIWKEMGKEKDRLRAHFVHPPEHEARVD